MSYEYISECKTRFFLNWKMLSPLSPVNRVIFYFRAAGEVTNEYKQLFYSEQLFRTEFLQETIVFEALRMDSSHLNIAKFLS